MSRVVPWCARRAAALASRAVPRVGTPSACPFTHEGRDHPHVEPMINTVLTKVFGTHNDRELKRISEAHLGPINALEPAMEKLADADLRHKTEELKNRITAGESLDDILVDAFAAAREAGRRAVDTPSTTTCWRNWTARSGRSLTNCWRMTSRTAPSCFTTATTVALSPAPSAS